MVAHAARGAATTRWPWRGAGRRTVGGRLAAAILCGLLGAAPAGAQELQFRHLGVADGLPSSLVSDIVRDRRGFMWFGTDRGMSRYDGHEIRTYAHDVRRPDGLPAAVVTQIYEDRAGTLWAVTDKGLSRYVPTRDDFETWRTAALTGDSADGTAGAVTTSILEDRRGVLWVGTSVGLFRLDPRTGATTPFDVPSGLRRPSVMTLHEDRSGRLWVGARDGLYVFDAAGRLARHYRGDPADPGELPDTVVRSMTEDAAGDLWIGTGYGGLVRMDARTGQLTRFRHDPADSNSVAKDRVVKLAADRVGTGVWVGTENGGLDHFDAATGRFVHHRYDPNATGSISSNSVWSLYQDDAGAVWVGTFSGGVDIAVPNGAAIRHYAPVTGDATSLSYRAVTHFAEDRAGHVWVTTDGGGLNEFDPRTHRFTRYTPRTTNLNSEAILGVLEDRRGDIWVAAWDGGVSRLDRRRRRFTAYTVATGGLPDNNVYTLVEDHAGRLWAGMENGMVAVFDRARDRFTRRYTLAEPGRSGSAVTALLVLHDGTIAAGLREGGLVLVDPETGRQRHVVADPADDRGLSSNNVRALFEAAPGVLWIGTDDGLDRLTLADGRSTHLGPADGLPNGYVHAVLADDAGRLWISTDHGLSRFDPRTRTFAHFGHADGLQRSEYLMRAALRARDGTLYFGGNDGFDVVRPERVVANGRPPAVVLTGLALFNRPVRVGARGSPLSRPISELRELTLTHAENVVTFEFAALDYTAPEKNRYAYRMDGFDDDWQDVGHQHAASYTNLAPGRYRFRVRATNSDGVWSDGGASIDLVITPPLWGTWWFRLLAAAAGAVTLYRLWRFQQRRRLEVALGRQALRDPLTGLANRAHFHERVTAALARRADARPGASGAPRPDVAVLFVDLDDFKLVNDSLGHHAGDRLLCTVAARLLDATRGCDTVARFGGDEFAVLVETITGVDGAVVVAERVARALGAPVVVDDDRDGCGEREARVRVSVGIALAEPGLDADGLLRHADTAMYRAKADGKGGHALFDPAMGAETSDRLRLTNDLTHALARGELALAYQPIVVLDSGDLVGFEALARWHHPTRGAVSPGQFVPLAEASGLIVDLGRWVLHEACRAAAGWPARDGAAPGVTVNVSGRQLRHPAFTAHVAAALVASGLDPARLTLEITESVLMHDTAATITMLGALKTLGVRLAVDDFGTGYSSLRYLQQFPVDVLKIDKSFIDGLARGTNDVALVHMIVALARMLSMHVVAEGVERAEQREQLLAVGCELGQGYLFARPLTPDAVAALLAGGGARSARAA